MKILVVGGAGYIGSHVTLEAINHGYEVTVFDDLSSGFKKNIHQSDPDILILILESIHGNRELIPGSCKVI